MRIHDHYPQNGRVWRETLNPNQFVWTTIDADDENVDNGDGTFSPYVIDGNTVKHGKAQVSIGAGGQSVSIQGTEVFRQSRIYLERFVDPDWIDVPLGGFTRTDTAGEEEGRITLAFTPTGYNLELDIIASPGSWGQIEIRFTPDVGGQYRIIWENKNLLRKGADYEPIIINTYPGKDFTQPPVPVTVGASFGEVDFRWTVDEAPFRTVEVAGNGQRRDLRLIIGPYTVGDGETLTIFPDTWGANTIAGTNDDCEETGSTVALSGTDGDGCVVGNLSATSYLYAGRWDNMPAGLASASSIDAGTQISPYITYHNSTTVNVLVYATREDDPADWNSGTNPSARTWTTANHSDSVGSGDVGGRVNMAVDTELEEVRANQTWATGNAVALVIEDNANSSGDFFQAQDYANSPTNACQLTVVYTAAGGATALPFRMRY